MASPVIAIRSPYPLELYNIKALCVQRQYRQCIQACRDILKAASQRFEERPIQEKLYVKFYLGLAHDELARLMQDFSKAKIPAFNQAEQFYKEALAALPLAEKQPDAAISITAQHVNDAALFEGSGEASRNPTPERVGHYLHNQPASSHTTLTSIRTDSRSKSVSRETNAADSSDAESHSGFGPNMAQVKVSGLDMSPTSSPDISLLRPKRLQRKTSTSSGLPGRGTDVLGTLTEEQNETTAPASVASEHLIGMRTQLERHILMLDKARQQTIVAQAARAAGLASITSGRTSLEGTGTNYSRPNSSSSRQDSVLGAEPKYIQQTRGFSSPKSDNVKARERQERIQAGRERNWSKERFMPQKYMELAESALAEL